jgi:hypothetical protein
MIARRMVTNVRSGPAHAAPYDVDTAVLSDSELSSANCTHSRSGMGHCVDLDGFGKLFLTGLALDIEDVTACRLAFEVDEVDRALRINCGLGLNAIVWGAQQADIVRPTRLGRPTGEGDGDKGTKERKPKRSYGFHMWT